MRTRRWRYFSGSCMARFSSSTSVTVKVSMLPPRSTNVRISPANRCVPALPCGRPAAARRKSSGAARGHAGHVHLQVRVNRCGGPTCRRRAPVKSWPRSAPLRGDRPAWRPLLCRSWRTRKKCRPNRGRSLMDSGRVRCVFNEVGHKLVPDFVGLVVVVRKRAHVQLAWRSNSQPSQSRSSAASSSSMVTLRSSKTSA